MVARLIRFFDIALADVPYDRIERERTVNLKNNPAWIGQIWTGTDIMPSHLRSLALTPRSWDRRSGMLFAGAIHTLESPNYDSLCWFVDEVLPLIERHGYETRLTVAGFTTGDVGPARFQNHPRITLRGPSLI